MPDALNSGALFAILGMMTVKQDTFRICFLAACCLFLSTVEYAVPKPLPFMRLGLANLPILLSVKKLKIKDVLALTACKVLVQSLVGGTLLSYIFVFSVAGSFASCTATLLLYHALRKSGSISFIGLSLAGALANNAAQLACARLILFGGNTRYIAPLLLGSGLLSGLLLGIFANLFERQSLWYAAFGSGAWQGFAGELPAVRPSLRGMVLAALAVLALAAVLCSRRLAVVWGVALLFFVLSCAIGRGRPRILPALIVVLGVTFFSLLTPSGMVLLRSGPLVVTQGALEAGLHRSGVLTAMVLVSRVVMGRDFRLPGRAGALAAYILSAFALLSAGRISFRTGDFIASIDRRLQEAQRQLEQAPHGGDSLRHEAE